MMVLIGGGGFLGTHVRSLLAQRGVGDVAVVARNPASATSTGREIWLSSREFEAEPGDRLIEAARCIVCLATASVPSTFAREPWNEVQENVYPMMRLLDRIATRNDRVRLVYLSSGGTVYGQVKTTVPLTEQEPLAPISAYGLGKVMIEQAVCFTGRTKAMRYSILRVANPVGIHAHESAQGLVVAALRAICTQIPLDIFGDGSHVRDYLDADDVAEAILAAAGDRERSGAVWNVGSGQGRSNMDILKLVGRVAQRPVPFRFVPARGIDVARVVLDCAKIKDDLGWRARRDLFDTITAMWQAKRALLPASLH